MAREEKAAFESQEQDQEDEEGFETQQTRRPQPIKIAPTLELGPVGTADGGTGEIDSVWADGDTDGADDDGKASARHLVGKGKGSTADINKAGPPGKRSKPN